MKMVLRTIVWISLLFGANAWPMDIQGSLSGAWYNEDQSGHGLSVEIVSPDLAVAFWYVFDPQGNPLWLAIHGPIEGNTIRGQAFYVDGMVWGEFDSNTKYEHEWGTVDIEFVDCNNAMVTWDSLLPQYGNGQLSMVRLTSILGSDCYDSIESTTGYWQVSWSDLTTGTTQGGTAIIDDGGLVTANFEDRYDELGGPFEDHLGGMLSKPGLTNEAWVLDGKLVYGRASHSREHSMVGAPTDDGFKFTSDTDEFDFSYMPNRPNVPVSQAYLDGEWAWSWTTSDTRVEISNGYFSWVCVMMGLEITTEVQMMAPYYGGNTIPLEVYATYPPAGESLIGHAFYWRDEDAGMEYMELRWIDIWYILLQVDVLERPIPQ